MSDETIRPFLLEDAEYETRLTQKFLRRKVYQAPDPRKVTAFIPGVIQRLYVEEGQRVKRGDPLLVLEAMKMKNDLLSPRDGKIRGVYIRTGQMVPKGTLLLEFD